MEDVYEKETLVRGKKKDARGKKMVIVMVVAGRKGEGNKYGDNDDNDSDNKC